MHGRSFCWLHPRLLLTHEKLRWRLPSEFSCACTPHVRGGSVSCRGLNQAAGNRAHLSGGTPYAEAHKPNASRSSGEGVWGRGASLREAASPPESPHRKSLREGARGRGILYQRSPLPRKSSITPDTRSGSASASANCRGTCRRGSWSPSNAGGSRPSRDRRSTRQCRPRGGARSHRGRQRGSHG